VPKSENVVAASEDERPRVELGTEAGVEIVVHLSDPDGGKKVELGTFAERRERPPFLSYFFRIMLFPLSCGFSV
jgi:hypothetical protein